MRRLEGRTAVVTGAASGIGLAVANQLAAAGMQVVMADLDGSAVEAAADVTRRHGAQIEAVQVDVRDPEAIDRVADFAVRRFGGLHVAVNNAGIVNQGLAWELPLTEWHRVLDVNLWGVVHGVRSFIPRILATGEEGHVVNVASMAAVLPRAGLGPYTVAKHGILGLSDVLRADLAGIGSDIGVSVVMPGRIRTGMNPVGSIEPSDVARNVLDAIRRNRSYVFTDDHSADEVRARLEAILGARAEVLPD